MGWISWAWIGAMKLWERDRRSGSEVEERVG